MKGFPACSCSQYADHREQDFLLLAQVRLQLGANLMQQLSRLHQLRVLGAMDLAHLGGQLAQARQLTLEELVMAGYQVINEGNRREAKPVRNRFGIQG